MKLHGRLRVFMDMLGIIIDGKTLLSSLKLDSSSLLKLIERMGPLRSKRGIMFRKIERFRVLG